MIRLVLVVPILAAQVTQINSMNRNLIPPILIILAVGIFFTFTRGRIDELKTISATNSSYLQAINNSVNLIKTRDTLLASYNNLSVDDKGRLNTMIPDNIDNVRLIIDITNIGSRHGIALKGFTTSATDSSSPSASSVSNLMTSSSSTSAQSSSMSLTTPTFGVVTISFSFSSSYDNGISLLNDIQSSLRILDITHLTVTAGGTSSNAGAAGTGASAAAPAAAGQYSFSVQMQTYWLKQ